MSLNVLLVICGLEILGGIIFHIILSRKGLGILEIEDDENRATTRKKLIKCEHTILIIITILFILWCVSQFIFFNATINIESVELVLFSLVIIAVFTYLYVKIYSGIAIIGIQIFVCFFFVMLSIGNFRVSQEFIKTVEISHFEEEKMPEITGGRTRISTDYIDFFYFSENGSKKSVNTENYDIKVYYDVDSDDTEYYELYTQKGKQLLDGIGCYYDVTMNPRIEFHVHK